MDGQNTNAICKSQRIKCQYFPSMNPPANIVPDRKTYLLKMINRQILLNIIAIFDPSILQLHVSKLLYAFCVHILPKLHVMFVQRRGKFARRNKSAGAPRRSRSRAAKFRGRSKKRARGALPRPARHNFSQIYANSLVDVGQPVERLSPRLICRATSPIYASRACSKPAGVFTARRFTGTPG